MAPVFSVLIEAMQKFLDTSFPSLHAQLSNEERKQALQILQALRQADEILARGISYGALPQEEGRSLALLALAFSKKENVDDEFRWVPHQVLANIANAVPGALTGLYPQFLQQDFMYGMNSLFREADTSTRDLLLEWVENDEKTIYSRQELLELLAWIDDEVVRETFRRWRTAPPEWLRYLPALEDYIAVAGWEFTADGERRDLYYPTCYNLVPAQTQFSEQPEPVEMILPHESHCGWCQRPLVTLFDLRLSDPRLSFLSLEGKRLRIAICPNCSIQDCQVITNVDMQGGSVWSPLSGEPPKRLRFYKDDELEEMTLPSKPLVLGPLRRTPFISEGSHLGGCPEWVQNPTYPQCPQCQQTMIFLGQYEPEGVSSIEGIIYAFLCPLCSKATTVYQQT